MTFEKLPRLDDDGLPLPEVGSWSEAKYRLVANYASMFATSMKAKWDSRVYVDLFAGAGRAIIAGTRRIVPTTPTLALEVRDPFDRYIFCEKDELLAGALGQRVRRDHPETSVEILEGDSNQRVGGIVAAVPKSRSGHRVLMFCVVDPCSIGSLKFRTLDSLAKLRVDFLILVPSHMDANRNQDILLQPDYPLMDEFLGESAWREEWRAVSKSGSATSFGTFVLARFSQSMKRLRYLYDGPGAEVPVRDRGRILYYLAFFSRSPLGQKFWREAKRYSTDQLDLPLT